MPPVTAIEPPFTLMIEPAPIIRLPLVITVNAPLLVKTEFTIITAGVLSIAIELLTTFAVSEPEKEKIPPVFRVKLSALIVPEPENVPASRIIESVVDVRVPVKASVPAAPFITMVLSIVTISPVPMVT